MDQSLKFNGRHRRLLEFHKELMRLRKSIPALYCLSKDNMDVISLEEDRLLAVRRWNESSEVLTLFNFNDHEPSLFQNIPYGIWNKRIDSSDSRWFGSGATVCDRVDTTQVGGIAVQPQAVVLFEREIED